MSTLPTNRVWLSREGKTEGPFSSEQIQALKDSGEFSMYAWLWDEGGKSWKPIHPVPGAPVEAAELGDASEAAPVAPKPSAPAIVPSGAVALKKALSAVCHDNRHIMGGTVDSLVGIDGLFKSEDHLEGFPPFRKGHQIWVNLLDEASGRSENVTAEIMELKRSESNWEFRIKWKDVPTIVRQNSF